MSNCININGLELLAQEDTLLVHYSITCTGTWYLAQLSTAYRNVCDTEWTVMYPNHQHPRHTDFPILVTQPPYPATFAWNYGGIQGITAESFDEQHSYLVQLTIFDYDCFNTGQTNSGEPPGSGGTTGEPPGGTTGQPGTGGPLIPGGSNPGGGNPPSPGGATPGGGTPGGQPGSSSPSNPTITTSPTPSGPTTGGPSGPNTGGPSGPSTGGPAGTTPPAPGGPTTGGPGSPSAPTPTTPTPRPGGPTTGGPGSPTSSTPPGTTVPPGGGLPGTSGEPNKLPIEPISQFNEPSPWVYLSPYPEPTPPINPNVLGTQTEVTTPVTNNTAYNTNVALTFNRPSNAGPGETLNPNLSFTSISTSPAIPGEPNNNIGIPQLTSNVNFNQVNASSEGSIPGSLSSRLIGDRVVGEATVNQINTSSLETSAFMDVLVASEVVTIGEPIVISCVFAPPTAMQARATITVQDVNHSVTVGRTSLLEVSTAAPLTCGTSTLSSLYNLGELVVTCIVHDMNDMVIGIKSILVSNIEEVNNGVYQSSKVTISEDIPSVICNHGGMSNEPVTLDLSNNRTKYVLLTAETSASNFSSVLQTDGAAQTPYSMSVFVPSGAGGFGEIFIGDEGDGPPIDVPDLSGSPGFISSQSVFSSSSRYTINEAEVYPHTHTVGIANATIPPATNVAVKLSATSTSTAEYGKLYISSEFSLRTASGVASATSVTAYLPYGSETYGLILHGKASGQVPPTYTPNVTTTSNDGVGVWSGVALADGDYYSIVPSVNNVVNPFKLPVLTSIYTP
jgi:hypothetical protein